MTRLCLFPLAAVLVAASACTKKAETPPVPKVSAPRAVASSNMPTAVAADEHQDDAIAWRRGDVDGAVAEARAANKPVFLY